MDFPSLDSIDPRIPGVIAGVALLLFGRRLFWLAIGILGFLLGYTFAIDVLGQEARGLGLVFALFVGGAGAVLTVFFKKIAITVAGFLAGVYLLIWVAADAGWDTGGLIWVWSLLAGLVGAVLAVKVFNAALVVLTSIMGAGLLVDVIVWPRVDGIWLFFGLTVVGLVSQFLLLREGER